MQLHDIIPLVFRIRDEQNKGTSPDGVLKNIVYAIQQEYNTTAGLTADLHKLNDADNVPIRFLPLLADLLGLPPEGTWSEAKRRFFVKSVVDLYRIKSTHVSLKSALGFYGYSPHHHRPWELWKHDIYETHDYALYPDYLHRYKAARFDVRDTRIAGGETNAAWVRPGQLAARSIMHKMRPIHVLLRWPTTIVTLDVGYGFLATDAAPYPEAPNVVAGYWDEVCGFTTQNELATLVFTVLDPVSGAAVDADATPTAVVYRDGVPNGSAATVLHPALGVYGLQFLLTGRDFGKTISVVASWAVAGVAQSGVVFEEKIGEEDGYDVWLAHDGIELEVTASCSYACEATGCTTSCQGSACQVACQTFCDGTCQTFCEFHSG